jgi:hypothetical protein
MTSHYQDEQEIEAVVAGFEECTTGKDGFTHAQHLTVAVYYLRYSTPDDAFQQMRAGLLRFLDHQGVGSAKYKEQLTLSWIRLIQNLIAEMSSEVSLLTMTNEVIARLGDFRIPKEDDDREVGSAAVERGE